MPAAVAAARPRRQPRRGRGRGAAPPRLKLKKGAACPSLEPRRTFSDVSHVSDVSGIFERFRTFSDVSGRCRTFLVKRKT